MSIWINIFFEIKILKSYPIWLNIMTISMIKNWCSYNKWFLVSSSWIRDICNSLPSSNHLVHQ
jgi:hypothetical protein